jgi:hypothetical protein
MCSLSVSHAPAHGLRGRPRDAGAKQAQRETAPMFSLWFGFWESNGSVGHWEPG